MAAFAYVALDPSGKRLTGFVDAPSQEAAIANLKKEGRFVVQIKEDSGSHAAKTASAAHGHGRVTKSDIALFTRRMADLAGAGLPLDRCLLVVAEQSESVRLEHIVLEALEDVRGGLPVSAALAKHPKLFSETYSQTLAAGEASGQFPEVARRLAELQEKEVARSSQLVSALIYPCILTVVSISIITFLLTYVMPKLASTFKTLGGELPASTRLLLDMASFITTKGVFIIAGIVVAIFAYRVWVKTPQGRYSRDSFLLKLPAAGPIIKKAAVSRFARVLGTLVFGGVPILQSLRLAGMSSGNHVFETSALQVEGEVREGRPMAQAMRDEGSFPPVLTHMIAVGEETGDLAGMLSRVADSLDFEVNNGMTRLMAMMEPLIIVVMGLFVGFVVISVLLPIFQAQELVK